MQDAEQAAREWLEELRWPAGAVCVHCGASERVYRLRARPGSTTRPGLWKCGRCRKQFTVTVNTIFEETRLPLTQWLRAVGLECGVPTGIQARELARVLGITEKTARGVLRKIRYAAGEHNLIRKKGAVEGPNSLYSLTSEPLTAGQPAVNIARNLGGSARGSAAQVFGEERAQNGLASAPREGRVPRPLASYPCGLPALEKAVGVLLQVPAARKHPKAMERRLAEMEAARRKRESAGIR